MIKRIRRLTFLLCGIGAVVATASFSYFCLERIISSTTPVVQDLRVDPIYENYETIRAKANDGANITDIKYTIYVFPSVDYLDIYKDYLKDNSKPKPEDIYGHLVPKLLEDGTVLKDDKGVPIYSMVNGSDPNGINGYIKKMESYGTPLNGGTLNLDSFNSPGNATPAFNIYSVYSQANGGRKYGVPVDLDANGNDKNVLPIENFKNKSELNGHIGNEGLNQLGRKQLFEYDRLGYWEDLTFEKGRFLPVKMEFMNSVSPYVFNESIGKINMSMPDGNNSEPWFDHCFSGFTYALPRATSNDELDSGMPLYDLKLKLRDGNMIHGRDLFNGYDLNNIFDFTNDITQYCDENNIIRLFPTFSNGKGYLNTNEAKNDLRYGAKDAIKFYISNPNKKDLVMVPNYHNQTFYTDESKKHTINMAVAQNVPINNDTKFRVSMHISNGPSNWGGGEYNTNVQHDWITNVYDEKNIVSKLNGEGLYNFYLFVGDCGKKLHDHWNSPSIFRHGDGYIPNITIDEYFDGTNSTQYDDMFPVLKGKRMFKFPKKDGNKIVHYADAMGVLKDGKNTYNGNFVDWTPEFGSYSKKYYNNDCDNRPVYLLVQKSTLPKIYSDLNLENKNLEQNIKDNFNYADTGYRFAPSLYSYDESTKNVQREYYSKESGLNYQNLFMYHGLSIIDADYDYLQFRFGDVYNSHIHFNLNPDIKKLYYDATPEEIKQNKVGPKNIFTPASEFFELVNGGVQNQTFFKIKDSNNDKGIYDIILAIDTKNANEATGDITFDVFLYRHRNIFIKLFTSNKFDSYSPPKLEDPTTHFIQHDIISTTSNEHIWEGQYFIGQGVDENDLHIDAQLNKDVIGTPSHIEQRTLGLAIDNFVEQQIAAGKEYDYNNVVVKDYVTDAPIIWYEPISTITLTDVDPTNRAHFALKTNTSFKVLKNYIFYIDLFDPTMAIDHKW